VSIYFQELDQILTKYDLKDKPQHIYNIDEKGISDNHTPPRVVTDKSVTPVAVTAGMSYTVTVLGAGNALGTAIPPYFVFPGKRMRSELMEGSTVGADGTVSDSGWSNGAIFRQYLAEHFIKYVQGRDVQQPILLLYDGHRSHISLNIIEWAKAQNIILFVLPPHTSHVLQPLDVGCFGPFQRIYDNLRHKFMRSHFSSNIPKHTVCELGCQAYNLSLTANNLSSSFRKCGVYPFNPDAIDRTSFMPARVFHGSTGSQYTDCNAYVAEPVVNSLPASVADDATVPDEIAPAAVPDDIAPAAVPDDIANATVPDDIAHAAVPDDLTPASFPDVNDDVLTPVPVHRERDFAASFSTKKDVSINKANPSSPTVLFFRNKEGVLFHRESSTKKRKVLSAVVGGKPITEQDIELKKREHISGQTASKKVKKTKQPITKKPFRPPFKRSPPVPGPSGIQPLSLDSDVFFNR